MNKILVLLLVCAVSFSAWAAPGLDDINLIKSRFAQERLSNASIEFAIDGRLRLIGQYRDREEVQLAFSLAQQVAGVRWVAPTTPENVKYPPGVESVPGGILEALRNKRKPPSTTTAPSERYALIVGVGRYVERRIQPLPNAANDAKAFADFLEASNLPSGNLILLREEDATKHNVYQAMRNLRDRVKANDTIVMYFSTHGSKPNDLGNVPIVLHDTRIEAQRGRLDPKTTLQDDELRQFIEAVSPARVMIVLDVCYSGGAFAKIPGVLASTSRDLFIEESTFGTGASQTSLNYMAGRPQAGQEKILIAASGPGEKSWEHKDLKQGYFTYYFLDELKGKRDVQLAFDAAKPIVRSEVRRNLLAEQNIEVSQTPQATFIPQTANLKF